MSGGKIFISYRRADSQWAAARLYDALTAAFPDDRVFMDVEKIAPGQDFVDVLEGQVGACDVFLALIGPEWLSLHSADGTRRIDEARDFVRLEIASALGRAETVTIPILIDGAAPPAPADLPEDLRPLARRQFLRLTHEGYRTEVGALIDAIRKLLGESAARREAPAKPRRDLRRDLRRPAALLVGALLLAGCVWLGVERLNRSADPAGTPDLAQFTECGVCPEMVAIPAGSFMMGSPEGEPDRLDQEGPVRQVTVPRFAIARTETSWAAYAACVAETACAKLPDDGAPKEGMPAMGATWEDAQSFAAWLNGKVPGAPYRLPSEAEWEYAARAGTATPYYWGRTWDRARANMGREICCIGAAEGADEWVGAAPLASFPPNGFGLFDMAGNLAEWVEDVYRDDVENNPTDGSPRIWESDSPWARRQVLKGGSYTDRPWMARPAARISNDRNWRNGDYGFRLARRMVPR
ncbi:MAG: SUMF1/EgtB/PvdO family nonheme iron enzyme [Paracoccaceae bacterium]